MRTKLMVFGMKDNRCREQIVAALEGVPGVRDVHLSLHRGVASVDHDSGCECAHLIAAVIGAGYGAAPALL